MSDLLDLLGDEWTDAPAWQPIYKTGTDLTSMLSPYLCRDCGRKAGYNQGGGCRLGGFMVCDGCAQLDGCTTRQHDRGPEWHVSHWGMLHRADEHDGLLRAQGQRRRAYLAHRGRS